MYLSWREIVIAAGALALILLVIVVTIRTASQTASARQLRRWIRR
jgi:hypothetical protein